MANSQVNPPLLLDMGVMFRPEYAGKMNFYLSLLNQTVRKAHEQPSIGIIICQSKQRTVVEFALRDVNNRRTAQLSPLGWPRTRIPTHCQASYAPSSQAMKSWCGEYKRIILLKISLLPEQ